jgi:hypothetical protein
VAFAPAYPPLAGDPKTAAPLEITTTRLLHEDATFEMPPMQTWFRGRGNIGRFLATRVLTSPGIFTTVPAGANGQPALAIYRRADDGTRRAHGVQVLSLRESRVVGVVAFLDPGLLAAFGLPPELPAPGPSRSARPALTIADDPQAGVCDLQPPQSEEILPPDPSGWTTQPVAG